MAHRSAAATAMPVAAPPATLRSRVRPGHGATISARIGTTAGSLAVEYWPAAHPPPCGAAGLFTWVFAPYRRTHEMLLGRASAPACADRRILQRRAPSGRRTSGPRRRDSFRDRQ